MTGHTGLATDRDALPLAELSNWASPRIPGLGPFIGERLVAGGRSNLTFVLDDASGRQVVLRRPPARIEVRGAHDVLREYRILTALQTGTRVRVPRPLAASDDDGPLNTPFYLMEFVDGIIVRDDDSAASMAVRGRAKAGLALVEELARLHRVDAAATGLGDLGKPTGYLERNIARWSSVINDEAPFAADLRRVSASLTQTMPSQQASSLLHGDYRLDNCVLGEAGDVLAVLDWELATQGDPLVDLGWMLLYWQPSDELARILPRGSDTFGFERRDTLIERYQHLTGLDLTDLDYYLAFAAWRLAVITFGVQSRYAAGGGAGDHVHAGELTRHVELLAQTAADYLKSR